MHCVVRSRNLFVDKLQSWRVHYIESISHVFTVEGLRSFPCFEIQLYLESGNHWVKFTQGCTYIIFWCGKPLYLSHQPKLSIHRYYRQICSQIYKIERNDCWWSDSREEVLSSISRQCLAENYVQSLFTRQADFLSCLKWNQWVSDTFFVSHMSMSCPSLWSLLDADDTGGILPYRYLAIFLYALSWSILFLCDMTWCDQLITDPYYWGFPHMWSKV